VFLGWWILGWVGQIALALWKKPWGPELGVAASPVRWMYYYSYSGMVTVPSILLMISYITSQHNEWQAPRGRYQEGEKYSVLSSYNIVAMAMTAAMFAAAGIFRPAVFDLCATPAAIGSFYFSPIVGFITLWIGGALRSIFFGVGLITQQLPGWGLADGALWMMSGIVFHLQEEHPRFQNRIVRLVSLVVFLELYRYLTLSGPVQFWLNPAEAFWVAFINFWVVFMPGSVISLIAGWIVSEAAAARIKARS
jgi:hypothetical protein